MRRLREEMGTKCFLILGGARSGKSRFAEEVASQLGQSVLFVATGEALDEEMRLRIEDHKKSRHLGWRKAHNNRARPPSHGQRRQPNSRMLDITVLSFFTSPQFSFDAPETYSFSNSSLPAPQTGHTQSSGSSSKEVPGAMPLSGSPFSGS